MKATKIFSVERFIRDFGVLQARQRAVNVVL